MMKKTFISVKMTHLILLLIFSMIFYQGKAQSGLQFSAVLLVNNNAQTVPAGKVWKVEAITSSSAYPVNSQCTNNSNDGDYGTVMIINGVNRFTDRSYAQTSGYQSMVNNLYNGSKSLPFWLPPGATLQAFCANSLISVIEFSIVP